MVRQRPWAAAVGALAAGAAASGSGCSGPSNPWTYSAPPAVAASAFARPREAGKTVIAVAQFENPDAPQLPWPDVGAEITAALRRTIYVDGDFEVRIAPEIEHVVSKPKTEVRASALIW